MSSQVRIRGSIDSTTQAIQAALINYLVAHPSADIELYRRNSVSVRIRIVDPGFHGLDQVDRHEQVWQYLDNLPEDVVSDISMVVLLTRQETAESLANLEFEDASRTLI
ncbi:MAG: hypothetical protein WD894_13500 [Pirellulales bacterium]